MANFFGDMLERQAKVETPKWIDDIQFRKVVTPKLNVEFDTNTILQKNVTANRIENVGNIRELKVTLTDKQLQVFAINELAKTLRGRHYKVTANVKDGVAVCNVNFENNPFEYEFVYNDIDGVITPSKTFTARCGEDVEEYPFNNAGIEDSFEDSKNIDTKKSIKTKNARSDYSIITRYEIVQRCNNKLTLAKELIEKNIKEENIVAVGSNEYASIYDVNMLFPDMREGMEKQESHTFNYVDNKVSERINEKKTANRLAIEAISRMNENFHIDKIVSASRDNDTFKVKSVIAHNNIRDEYTFVFDISKEKISHLAGIEDESNLYSVNQLVNKFKEEDANVAEYISESEPTADGYVYSINQITKRLSKYVPKSEVENLIQNWFATNKVSKITSDKIASKYSVSELIRTAKFLSKDDVEDIQKQQRKFGEDERFYFYEVQDGDTRNELAKKARDDYKNSLVKKIGKYFSNFDVEVLGGGEISIRFNSPDGKNRSVFAYVEDGDIYCYVGENTYALNKLQEMFKTSELLSAYAIPQNENLSQKHKLIISSMQFANKLKDYLTTEQVNELIQNLISDGKLVDIGSDKYASKYSFNQLLNEYTNPIDKEIKAHNLVKSNRTTLMKLVRNYINDGDTRTAVALNNVEKEYTRLYDEISKYVNNFKLNVIGGNKAIIAFVSEDGKNRNVVIGYDNNDIMCVVGNKEIPIKNLADRFKTNPVLKQYVADGTPNESDRIIISKRMIHKYLEDILNEDDIDDFVSEQVSNNNLIPLTGDNRIFASEMSFEDLIRNCNCDVDKALRKNNLLKKSKVEDKKFDLEDVQDCDTRNAKKILTEADFKVQFNNALPDNIECVEFNDISVSDVYARCIASVFNKTNGLTITANFDMRVHDGMINTDSISNLDYMFNLSTVNKHYNKFNDISDHNHKVIISKRVLKEKLEKIANLDNIDAVIKQWEDTNKIVSISDDKFVSEYSVEDLISSSNIVAYSDDEVQARYNKSKINTLVVPKEYHVQDSDIKILSNVTDGKTKDHLNDIKNECNSMLDELVAKNMVTSSRVSKIREAINNAGDYTELDDISKNINRYME